MPQPRDRNATRALSPKCPQILGTRAGPENDSIRKSLTCGYFCWRWRRDSNPQSPDRQPVVWGKDPGPPPLVQASSTFLAACHQAFLPSTRTFSTACTFPLRRPLAPAVPQVDLPQRGIIMAKPLGPKSTVIRDPIAALPNMGNTELAKILNDAQDRLDDHLEFKPKDVAAQRQALKKAEESGIHGV